MKINWFKPISPSNDGLFYLSFLFSLEFLIFYPYSKENRLFYVDFCLPYVLRFLLVGPLEVIDLYMKPSLIRRVFILFLDNRLCNHFAYFHEILQPTFMNR